MNENNDKHSSVAAFDLKKNPTGKNEDKKTHFL